VTESTWSECGSYEGGVIHATVDGVEKVVACGVCGGSRQVPSAATADKAVKPKPKPKPKPLALFPHESRKLIFVSGPLGANDAGRAERVANAVAAGRVLLTAGLEPFVPHILAPLDEVASYERMMRHCFAWLERCHALLRIPGESPGADREVVRAKALGLPVFFLVDSVIDWSRACQG